MHYLTRVVDRNYNGWLEIEKETKKILLPYSTKVSIIKSDTNGEWVKIMEGDKKYELFKVPFLAQSPNSHYSFFTDEKINFSMQTIHINIKDKTLNLDGKLYDIEINKNFNIGRYYLKFPIRKQDTKFAYLDETKGGSRFSDSWFPLISKNELDFSKYLHYGTYSRGCITVKHIIGKKTVWSEIFFKIMHSRINDNYLARVIVN